MANKNLLNLIKIRISTQTGIQKEEGYNVENRKKHMRQIIYRITK